MAIPIKTLLKNKIQTVFSLLLIARLSTYIPVPNLDLDIFLKAQALNPIFGLAQTLNGKSFLGIGSLGILPYINASIIMQVLTVSLPNLRRLQKEEGEAGRRQINKYTKYLTFIWAIVLSTATAFFLVKPVLFNWNFLFALKIIVSLTAGALLFTWIAELITEEGLGNGSSMIIFINIIGSIPNNLNELLQNLTKASGVGDNLVSIFQILFFYFFSILIIVLFQDGYKKVKIVSAKQLTFDGSDQNASVGNFKTSYIPIKINQGGIMPLVFSSGIATILYSPLQIFASSNIGVSVPFFPALLTTISIILNIVLILFFSSIYALIILKPSDLTENLEKMAYNVPGIRQGKQTTKYLKQTIVRLAFIGGLFLAFLSFFPLILGNIFKFTVFKNITSLLILLGVLTDITSHIRGYLIAQNYENS
jgi:preprotein translocase subunit SecY